MDCPVLKLNSVDDHIHILFNLHRTIALSEVVKQIKQTSSKWMKTKPQCQSFSWQAGFGAFSVSEMKKDAVINYIQNQQEHHRRVSYQDELREIFRRHGVIYDERYVWE